jgi:phospholipid transport system substrate-binding protein
MKEDNKMKLRYLFTMWLCLFWGIALAADPPPLALIKQVSTQTLNELQKYRGKQRTRRVIHSIINRIVVPHFALPDIARSVVGRNYWYQATESTRSQFIKAFTGYVIDMYSGALTAYSNETLSFKPIRDFNPSQSRIQVYSIVNRPGASSVNLNYRLVQQGNSWKIYDFSVDGVSMVQSYKAQFASSLSQGGLTGLTKELQTRNR